MNDIDFGQLIDAMWNDTLEWRQLDRQIRDMNKRLSAWRRGTPAGRVTYRATQKAAFEMLVTMQTIYAVMERAKPEPAQLPALPEPSPVAYGLDAVILEPCGNEISTPRWIGWDHIHASPDIPNVGMSFDVAAA